MSTYLDPVDGTRYPLNEPRWRSAAGRPLWIEPGPGIGRQDVETADRSLWRYRAALPVAIDDPITLGEGMTPLLERRWVAGGPVLVKAEWLSPTGSFKDRGTAVMLSYLRQHGIAAVLEDSSGNGGSSVAGYAAAGGLQATICAPAATSPAKIAQVRAYGATVHLVEGPREASQQRAIDLAESGDACYASHNWQAFFLQGTKTQAYELWEDLGFRAPDNVVMPVGAGSSLLGCYLGFAELLAAGQIERMPRLFAAQPLHCSPLDAAVTAGTEAAQQRPVLPTLAEGTAIARPLRLAQMVAAVTESGGGTVAVPEDEIVHALELLCSDGLFVEPTSATAAAAYLRLCQSGTIDATQSSVVMLSGSGLKAAGTVADLLAQARQGAQH